MEFRWLGNTLGRLCVFWVAWWFATIAVIITAFATGQKDLTPTTWRGLSIVALLFFSGAYGTLKLVQISVKELDRLPSDE
jgi:hypothetical protein